MINTVAELKARFGPDAIFSTEQSTGIQLPNPGSTEAFSIEALQRASIQNFTRNILLQLPISPAHNCSRGRGRDTLMAQTSSSRTGTTAGHRVLSACQAPGPQRESFDSIVQVPQACAEVQTRGNSVFIAVCTLFPVVQQYELGRVISHYEKNDPSYRFCGIDRSFSSDLLSYGHIYNFDAASTTTQSQQLHSEIVKNRALAVLVFIRK